MNWFRRALIDLFANAPDLHKGQRGHSADQTGEQDHQDGIHVWGPLVLLWNDHCTGTVPSSVLTKDHSGLAVLVPGTWSKGSGLEGENRPWVV